MSFHSVQKGFNWPANHLLDVLSDPNQTVVKDIMGDTGRNVAEEAMDSTLPLSIQGLQRAVKLGRY